MKNRPFPARWSSALLALMMLTMGLVAPPQSAAAPPNVSPRVWAETADGGQTSFMVILREQADLSGAETIADRVERIRFVVERLRQTADRTQGDLRALLERRGVDYRAFYIINALVVTGNRALVRELAARPDVARIDANPTVHIPLPEPASLSPASPTAIEWNVLRVNADDVWAMGYHGEGIVIAGQDTGYDWDHPALINKYRGWNGTTASHDYNWHDAIHSGGGVCGANSSEPCDDHGHGTHTMGTMVGDDGGSNQVGVAPGARWIGCRNMNVGYGTPATYTECFEFFLAPYPVGGTPAQGRPEMAPHVINNSWGCPPSEGCNWNTLQQIVETVRAAGILVVSSAGNDGSACSTVRDPIAIYDAAFSVGATDSSNNIASFSSRGPVTIDGSNRRKPDISAPGVGVRSSARGGGYTTMSGTSMAAPHVAGVAALLWSYAPYLVGRVDETETVLERSANPRTSGQGCGGDSPTAVPNNVYGWGIVDALAAVHWISPTLALDVQAALPLVQAGETLTYTLRVTNTGNISLTATITDVLPQHVTPSGTLVWTPTIPAPGGVWTQEVTVTVHWGYSGTLTNTVEVTTLEGAKGEAWVRVDVRRHTIYLPFICR